MSRTYDDDLFDLVEADKETTRCISAEEDAREERLATAKRAEALVQRVNTATIDTIMAEVASLPLEEQLAFVSTLCRRSVSGLPQDEYLHRLRAAHNSRAFLDWVLANADVLGVAHEDELDELDELDEWGIPVKNHLDGTTEEAAAYRANRWMMG